MKTITDGKSYAEQVRKARLADNARRRRVPMLPRGKRPQCLACRRELRPYRWREDGSPKLYGTYGDNRFCGLSCGYRYALAKTGGARQL